MDQPQSTPGAMHRCGRVEIRIKGQLPPRWRAWFDDLTITAQDDGTTLIHGPVIDQAALFGHLQRLRDLALPLVSVVHVDPDAPPEPVIDRPGSSPTHPRSQS